MPYQLLILRQQTEMPGSLGTPWKILSPMSPVVLKCKNLH